MLHDVSRELEEIFTAFQAERYQVATSLLETYLQHQFSGGCELTSEKREEVFRPFVYTSRLITPTAGNASLIGGRTGEVLFRNKLVEFARKYLQSESKALIQLRSSYAFSLLRIGREEDIENTMIPAIAELSAKYGDHHQSTREVRSQLARFYHLQNRPEKAFALFRETGICEDLGPVESYLRGQGIQVANVSAPYEKSHIWVYLSLAALDTDSLMTRFRLPEFVKVYNCEDYHFAPEKGLCCEKHWDAIIGTHPNHLQSKDKVRIIG